MGTAIVTAQDFEREVSGSDLPVFVKFSAPWCAPCKAMAPMIDALAEDYGTEMKFVDIDIDESPELATANGIRGVPTFLVIREGQVFDRAVGAQSRTRMAELIEAGIEGASA